MTDEQNTQIHHHYSKPHITSWIEAGCAIVLIFITGFYTRYASQQADASKQAANAATEAARIAGATLKEIQKGGTDTHTLAVQAKNQAEATRKIAENALAQARATNNLAREAKRSADIAQGTREAEDRPWLGYDHMNFPSKIHVGSTIKNSLVYRNWGKAPAVHVTHLYEAHIYCNEFPKHPDYNVITSASAITLMPNQPAETGDIFFPKPLGQEEFDIIQSPNCGLYFYARILYRDTAKHQHWLHWCGKWVVGTDAIQTCTVYNDGDQDYPDGKEP